MKRTFYFLFPLILFACNLKTGEVLNEGENPISTSDEFEIDTATTVTKTDIPIESIDTEEPDNEVVEVILEFRKTACFGDCPTFSVELLSDGRIFFNGKANVEKIGLFESNVNDSFVFTLFQEAENIDFFSLDEKYPKGKNELPDLPKTITYLKNGKKSHKVTNSYSSPLALQQFEKYILSKFDNLYWVKIGPED